jgi:hypothetical protein
MTLEEFTHTRRDELVAFFKARFGKHWRQAVTRQAREHPRLFDRWPSAPPRSLYRPIYRLEKWARTIGFESALDDRVQERLRAYQAFKKAASQEVETVQRKRNERSRADEDLHSREMKVKMAEALRRMREAAPTAASC